MDDIRQVIGWRVYLELRHLAMNAECVNKMKVRKRTQNVCN